MPDETENQLKAAPIRQTGQMIGRAVKDVANREILKPVKARVMKRVKEIEALSSANHERTDVGDEPQWETTPPEMFIAKLTPSIINGVGVITYYKYKTRINKKTGELEKHPRTITRPHPFQPEKTIDHSVVYPYECLVKETFEYGKPTKIEEVPYHDAEVDA